MSVSEETPHDLFLASRRKDARIVKLHLNDAPIGVEVTVFDADDRVLGTIPFTEASCVARWRQLWDLVDPPPNPVADRLELAREVSDHP